MLERLDAAGIRRWADLGLAALGRHRAEIDALNVFPVPDGDTGTNLFLTFESASAALSEAGASLDLRDTVRTFAHGALLGARGNSGIILEPARARLRRGARLGRPARGTTRRRSSSMPSAGRPTRAYAAVAEPVEGTVLTVARAAADAVAALGPGTSLVGLVTAAADAARDALARTPEQLEALPGPGSSTPGAAGSWSSSTPSSRRSPASGARPAPSALPIPARRTSATTCSRAAGAYEVMYLLDADEAAVHALRAALGELGDSLVVVGGGGLWNVHVHSDDVGAAIEAGIEAGRPHRIRVTDLRRDTDLRRGADGARRPRRRRGRPRHRAPRRCSRPAAPRWSRAHGNVAPSTAELLDGVHRAAAGEVVLLPSDSDIRPRRRGCGRDRAARGLRVVGRARPARSSRPSRRSPCTTPGVVVRGRRRRDDAGGRRHAVRRRLVRLARGDDSAGLCRVGDVLGIVGGDVVEIGDSVQDVAAAVLARLLADRRRAGDRGPRRRGGRGARDGRGQRAPGASTTASRSSSSRAASPTGRSSSAWSEAMSDLADWTTRCQAACSARTAKALEKGSGCARSRTCCATTRAGTPSAASSPTSRSLEVDEHVTVLAACTGSTSSSTGTSAPAGRSTGSRSSWATVPAACS